MLKLLAKIKENLEPSTWLIATGVSAVGALVGAFLYLENYLKTDIIASLVPQYDKKFASMESEFDGKFASQGSQYEGKVRGITETLKNLQESDAGNFTQINRELFEEIDSTYYFTKRFVFLKTPESGIPKEEQKTSAEPSQQSQDNQESMEEFFYLAPGDNAILYIWSDKTSIDLYIWSDKTSIEISVTINGGKPQGLKELKSRHWTGVNITELVQSSHLDFEQFPGISENVHEIAIIPKLKDQIKKTITTTQEKTIVVDVYALLVVRRGPLK